MPLRQSQVELFLDIGRDTDTVLEETLQKGNQNEN